MSPWYRGSSVKFDPSEFSVPPSLKDGTSQRLQLWIQSAHARALDIIAHSGHFPWGKDTDVARWCIQHGIQYITNLDEDIQGLKSLMRQANIIDAINAEMQRNLSFMGNFDKLQQNVLTLKGIGELEMAKDLVNRVWSEIQQMPDEPEREGRWKKKYLDKFTEMFRDMIDFDE